MNVLVDMLVDICLYIPLIIPDVPVSAGITRKWISPFPFLPIFREIYKFKLLVQIIKMIEYVWSVNIMVLLLLGGVGYGLYLIFTMDSPGFESKNIDLDDIGHNH